MLTLIQIAPIRINPWSFIARAVGNAINADLLDKIDRVEKEVIEIGHAAEERYAVDCRTRILRFGDEILHSEKHSKEHFDQILRDITTYEQYCETHPEFENNTAVLTAKKIKETYQECMTEHSFW